MDDQPPEASPAGQCAYCQLPVCGATDDIVYCCYGCRFAHAVVQEQGAAGAIQWTVIRLGLAIFFTMNLMAFTMTMWSLDVYRVDPDPFQQSLFEVFRWLSMVLALPVLMLLGGPLLQNAISGFRQRRYSTDPLILLAVAAAYLTSAVHVLSAEGPIYFEVGAMVLVMITLGRWIEAAGRQKATHALDALGALLPETALRLTPGNERPTEEQIPSTEILKGDRLRVRAGERIPVDARLTRGRTSVDEQVFTGESLPTEKHPGDPLLAGTVNLEGDIQITASEPFQQGSFGRLVQALQDARRARGRYQQLSDRMAACFFPIVSGVAAATFCWHLATGLSDAISVAMSVLLIACPCALGLATPLAVWTSLATAARHQVLFRGGAALEQLADAAAICFDKTGTLTTGSPRVTHLALLDELSDEDRAVMATLAHSSSHPFSQAIAEHLHDNGDTASLPESVSQLRTVAGGGVTASVDGHTFRLGSVEFACCHQTPAMEQGGSVGSLCVNCQASVPLATRVQLDRLQMSADQQAASIVLFTRNQRPLCGFLITETLRPEAGAMITAAESLMPHVRILTGDRRARAQSLQQQLPLRTTQVLCELSPQQKLAHVQELQQQGCGTVMVGDGINDAPALAASDVGLAMGCGADVTRDCAAVCLLSNDLTRIPWAIHHARRTRRIMRQNLFWAFSYNSAGILVAACGLLNPALAAALMIGSSLMVISNSLRLLHDPTAESGDDGGVHLASTEGADGRRISDDTDGSPARTPPAPTTVEFVG